MLGHELGNVLNGLSGMVELLRESGLPAEQDRWLKAIEQSGRQLRRLIDSFQSKEPGSSYGIRPRISRFDGLNLLEEIVISHMPAARIGDNRLLLIVDPELSRHWCCDPCMLRQLLDNLLGNAVKYTRSGEVILEAAFVPAGAGESERLALMVSDSGPGIMATDGGRIFGAYQRVTDGDGNADGAGLGLYICKEVVRALQGNMEWMSPERGGSCFRVVLPGVPHRGARSRPEMGSSLLARIRCRLRLDEPLERCVECILTRLGVEWSDQEPDVSAGEGVLTICISDAGPDRSGVSPALLFAPLYSPGGRVPERLLYPPILQSTLEPLLMEMALESVSRESKR